MSSHVALSNGDELWRLKAECRPGNGYDPELWFPIGHNQHTTSTTEQDKARAYMRRGQIRRAKAICENLCPVRKECLDHAILNDEREGIWGGLTPHERGARPLR